MRIIETKVYKINEHPNKEKCFEWINNNWHDLNQHSVDDLISSIKALNNEIGGTFDYSISQVSDRGEFISFKDYSNKDLFNLESNDCPLTGCISDCDLIDGLKNKCFKNTLESLHNETEYIYSDEGLFELCEENGYEFDINGKHI